MGVVAYGVYDCVVVKQSVRDAAVKTYRETVRSYVAQQHIAEQVFTYEELRTAANLYAAGLITSLPNAKANKVSLVQSNSSKYPQLLAVQDPLHTIHGVLNRSLCSVVFVDATAFW